MVLTQFLLALVGHFSKECPQGGGGGVCYNCGLVLLSSGIILINSNSQQVRMVTARLTVPMNVSSNAATAMNLDTVQRNAQSPKTSPA